MKKRIILAGAGHGHLHILSKIPSIIEMGYEITVLNSSKYHYYSGMGPGMLSDIYSEDECRFNVKKMTEESGGIFIEENLQAVDPAKKFVLTDKNIKIPYDVLSLNIGSHMRTTFKAKDSNIIDIKPIKNFSKIRDKVKLSDKTKEFKIIIIGGGFAAIECALNIQFLTSENGSNTTITILERGLFLSKAEKKFQRIILNLFSKNRIRVIENTVVDKIQNNIITTNENDHHCDLIINATGINPNKILEKSPLPLFSDLSLIVNSYLQCIDYPEIFGVGDCIYFQDAPLDKVGVYAVKQNEIVFNNIISFIKGKKLSKFKPQSGYLKILNTGFKTGLLKKGPLILHGKLPFILKDKIDQTFMKKYK